MTCSFVILLVYKYRHLFPSFLKNYRKTKMNLIALLLLYGTRRFLWLLSESKVQKNIILLFRLIDLFFSLYSKQSGSIDCLNYLEQKLDVSNFHFQLTHIFPTERLRWEVLFLFPSLCYGLWHSVWFHLEESKERKKPIKVSHNNEINETLSLKP